MPAWEPDRREWVAIALGLTIALALAWVLFGLVGWLGVGLVGLIGLMVASRVALDGGRAVPDSDFGSTGVGILAGQIREERRLPPDQRAAFRAEQEKRSAVVYFVNTIGIALVALGFALYATSYAAAGALASRQQSADAAGQPVTYTLLAVYFAGYVALSADAEGVLAGVLTMFPLSAPLVLPARSALVGVPLWQHVLALVLVLASIYALVRFAGRVYGHGLLHGGPRLDPRVAWRLGRQS